MTERLVISVDAPVGTPDELSVQDAFAQIIELFDLVSNSTAAAHDQSVVWRLVSVTKNSPLTVTAEAYSRQPGVNVDLIARTQKTAFASNMRELKSGRIPRAWSAGKSKTYANNFVRRSRKEIGITKIEAVDNQEITVTADDLTQIPEQVYNDIPVSRKQQVGSIEGALLQVGTYYQKPAILIRERKTKAEIWCLVPDETARVLIKEHTDFEDVWSSSRILVRGTISYDTAGNIARVTATDARRVPSANVSEEKLVDHSFTGELGVTEYLDRLSEGTLG